MLVLSGVKMKDSLEGRAGKSFLPLNDIRATVSQVYHLQTVVKMPATPENVLEYEFGSARKCSRLALMKVKLRLGLSRVMGYINHKRGVYYLTPEGRDLLFPSEPSFFVKSGISRSTGERRRALANKYTKIAVGTRPRVSH